MSSRRDIIDGAQFDTLRNGLVYTEVLGWIDMGHARGDDIKALFHQFQIGEISNNPHYTIVYDQNMYIGRFNRCIGVGKYTKWVIQKGRTTDEINRIMLAMMMITASNFEGLQSLRHFSWYTDSGFSGEDLASDLFGFYKTLIPSRYSHHVKPVSYESALRRWDYYGPVGVNKNRGFTPIIYPDPQNPCVRHSPYRKQLPHFMTWIKPWDDFTSGKVEVFTNNGTKLSFNKRVYPGQC
ncbi:hypothetical protein JMY81_11910 [Brenneria goodwinii]|uniref:hypothetical protein n=1 Tax=Brenneria goodwinii TaxID=1109412 RepID=UPI000EF2464C|nr:hypothetical protein [Brenneria goodwinii]MCG8156949.1 hypothetical protein [Brenneria goodwinii]MCG8161534.1 hypothetical protein [Brenneria goodwinii]MCG8165577.1 hypothetical protein [Brenneria goodwinii]MCG8170065.1 hypothetical protein [Brenneria goodwinii]MCG8174275.1 hypothetical protein [Brenneria goodwinii]